MFPLRYGRRNVCGDTVAVGFAVLVSSCFFVVWLWAPCGGGVWLFFGNYTGTRVSLRCEHGVFGVFKSLGLLVPVNFTPCGASISGLSTQWSSWGPYPTYVGGRSHLEVGFPLRCFQRLSRPNVANQPCPWQDNWHTRGSSVPVLSY